MTHRFVQLCTHKLYLFVSEKDGILHFHVLKNEGKVRTRGVCEFTHVTIARDM